MKKLLLLLCLLPGVVAAQDDWAIDRILATGFGFYPSGTGTLVGTQVPDFRLETPDGQVFSRESLRGRVVIMDFWATWCGWCKRLAEDFQRNLTKYPAEQVQLLGVTYKESDEERALAYWREAGYTFPMTLNSPEPGATLRAGHPTAIVIDQNGTIRSVHDGWSPTVSAEIDILVRYLLGELEVSEEAARQALDVGEYTRAMTVIDLMVDADPDAERTLWRLRYDALNGMLSPNASVYMDSLKERYAADGEMMQQLGEVEVDVPLVISNVNVVDVIDGRVIPGQDILIVNGRIAQISQMAGYGVKGEVVEGDGAYVIPGLIDAHMHIANGYEMTLEYLPAIHPHLEYLVKHGITTMRDAGGDASILSALKRQVEAGEQLGPNIYYSAFMAGPEYMWHGMPADSTQLTPWNQCLAPGSDLNAAMTAAKECGATGIKAYSAMTKEFFAEVAAAAKRHGLKVWGHATLFPAKPTDVAEAGMEVPSHVYMLEWENVREPLEENIFANYSKESYRSVDHENIDVAQFCEAMKRHGAIFDPTLCVSLYPMGGGEPMPWIFKVLADVYKSGVKIAAGTDCINDLNREYPYLYTELDHYVNDCGFSPIDALRSATIIAAETVGAEQLVGSVEVGKKADLILLDGNPLEDFDNLKKRIAVVKSGRIIYRHD